METGPERIPDLEPLWRSLYEHHRGIADGVAGVRPYEDTWRQRQGQYRGWLGGEEEAGLLIAERAARAVDHQQPRGLARLRRRLGDGRRRQVVVEVSEVHVRQCTAAAGAATGRAP